MEKKVLLFSGGFDSLLQEHLIKPDVLLHVNMQTSYSQKEIEALHQLPKSYQDRLIVIEFPLGQYERENKYLPYRNLILGTLALQYGQHVYFGFNASDDAPDKDRKFIRKMTNLFSHLNKNAEADMGWETNNFSFSTPFIKNTKTEMVALAIKEGLSIDLIRHNRTCYDSDSKIGCGVCNPCLNKAVALINNNIYSDNLYDSPIEKEELFYLYTSMLERRKNGEKLPKKYLNEIKKARGRI